MTHVTIRLVLAGALIAGAAPQQETAKGIRLERLSWVEAERVLTPETVVVLPLGAALKEHGPHLTLRNDLTMAEYFADRIAGAASVVVTPPLTYHFYPAFLEYPGSTSLSLETARDLTIQVARSLAAHGPRRFYVLNTGISTARALAPAADALAREGILLRYTDLGAAVDRVASRVKEQAAGSHADEIETSMMLYIDPATVDMTRAVRDITNTAFTPPLTRSASAPGTYSPSGVWGDATLATREKGEALVEGLVAAMLNDIEALRAAQPPGASPGGTASPPRVGTGAAAGPRRDPGACEPGVERDIKRVEAAFNSAWRTRDPERLALLWTRDGDLVHPNGDIEKGRATIAINRAEQFKGPEYRFARHVLRFGVIRCLTWDITVVDGQWDLQDVTDAAGTKLPRTEGAFTLVLQRANPDWLIAAYRYHSRPGAPPPLFLKRPGYPDKR